MTLVRKPIDEDQSCAKMISVTGERCPDSFVSQNQFKMQQNPDNKFFPKGAIAFFVLLVILSLGFWYGIYWLMISRS